MSSIEQPRNERSVPVSGDSLAASLPSSLVPIIQVTAIAPSEKYLKLLHQVGEAFRKRGELSGYTTYSSTGHYTYQGRARAEEQFIIKFFIPPQHEAVADLLVEKLREKVRQVWDAPVVVKETVEVNRETLSFAEDSLSARKQYASAHRQRIIASFVAVGSVLGMIGLGAHQLAERADRAAREQERTKALCDLEGLTRQIEDHVWNLDWAATTGALTRLPVEPDMAATPAYAESQKVIEAARALRDKVEREIKEEKR